MMTRPSWVARLVGGLAALLLALGLALAFFVVPPDAVQGEVQRIMYLHLPSVAAAYLAFVVTLGASVGYLWKRDLRIDAVALASAEVGVVFTAIVLASGAIWGKATWGVWWTWDARLTLTAIVFTIYAGYLMLRAFAEEPQAAARYGAVLGILGFLAIPLNHFAVQWWRTLHQPSSILRPGGPSMDSGMLAVVGINATGMLLLYGYLLLERWRLERLRQETRALRVRRKTAFSPLRHEGTKGIRSQGFDHGSRHS
jgi:heme exporter protein C